ncbi:MAG: SPASM domain-containing protein, partial [Candidatus Aminicenantales bacterium]
KPFLFAVAAAAARNDLFFDRITTNASWFKTPAELRRALKELRDAEYDGTFGVSVDAFHESDLGKVALFLRTAAGIWDRPDVAQILAVRGARDRATTVRIRRLTRLLGAKIVTRCGRRFIKAEYLLLPLAMIDLVPVGKADGLRDPWRTAWFKEDYCQGPGQVLYVLPDGSVKPCCGYATDSERLTIGNIYSDSAERILRKAARNPYVRTVFERGLSRLRGRLAADGVRFPGRTDNHCFFCHHVLTAVEPAVLDRALRALKT